MILCSELNPVDACSTNDKHVVMVGWTASQYIMYTGPVIALAILALLYLELDKRFPEK
jgi:hypothetical protein